MIDGKRVHVVLPAYNAARTLPAVVAALPGDVVDAVLLVDDASADDTVAVARALGLAVIVHPENRGYGGNQKTCYRAALDAGADVIVMVHPDGQHDPRLVPALAALVARGGCDVALGSRTLDADPRAGGMPMWRWVANRALTGVENALLGRRLSEWHTGFRAWSRTALVRLPFARNSDDFVFDNEMLVQAVYLGLAIGEVPAPTHYGPESSSIPPLRAVRYGAGVLGCAAAGWAARVGLARPSLLAGLTPGR